MNSHEIAEHATNAVEELTGALEAGHRQRSADAVSRGHRTLLQILPAQVSLARMQSGANAFENQRHSRKSIRQS